MITARRTILLAITVTYVMCLVCLLSACSGTQRILSFIVDDTVYATMNVADKDNISIPQDPVKTDYAFDGWFWDKGTWERPFTLNSLNDEPLTSNMSVYAKFTKIHEHTFSGEWSNNETKHWHSANCEHDLIKDEGHHSFNSQYICTVCGYSQLIYELNNEGTEYSLIGHNSCRSNIIIPSSYKGLPVTSIGEKAFYNCWSLVSVTIPNSINIIGDYAFHYCKDLINVNIPNSVTSIGVEAFYDCDQLAEITIGNGVKAIYNYAFYSCEKITSITIPNSVEHISSSAFSHCDGLKSIEIPDSVSYIGISAFEHCDELTSVTIGGGVTYLGDDAFQSCNKLENVTISEGISVMNCTAFRYCSNLTSINYLGTIEQWNAIEFHDFWYFNGIYVESVICSNGTIALK